MKNFQGKGMLHAETMHTVHSWSQHEACLFRKKKNYDIELVTESAESAVYGSVQYGQHCPHI